MRSALWTMPELQSRKLKGGQSAQREIAEMPAIPKNTIDPS